MMNSISGVGSATSDTKTTAETSTTLGKDQFLKLLIAQIKNQDPLNPIENTEFISQLAQFSALEQMTEMNTNLEETLTSNNNTAEAISNAMATNYFGKTVTAESNTIQYDGSDKPEIEYELPVTAAGGSLNITDRNGTVVFTKELTSLREGVHSVTWNGTTDLGLDAPAGTYTVSFSAVDALGGKVSVVPIHTGTVKGIAYQNGTAMLDLDGTLVSFDSIMEITE
jgi:flagellar basal-body rod modification protein FlgD